MFLLAFLCQIQGASCEIVCITIVHVVVMLKRIRKEKEEEKNSPIFWAIKLAHYCVIHVNSKVLLNELINSRLMQKMSSPNLLEWMVFDGCSLEDAQIMFMMHDM